MSNLSRGYIKLNSDIRIDNKEEYMMLIFNLNKNESTKNKYRKTFPVIRKIKIV